MQTSRSSFRLPVRPVTAAPLRRAEPASPPAAEPALEPVPENLSLLRPWAAVPARFPKTMPPRLVTLIDAEEAFDWSRPFSRSATDVSSMRQQVRAHKVFERHGVIPIYLVDYPVASQPDGIQPLQEFLADRVARVGAQLHPWVNPPFHEPLSTRNSFAGNLPAKLERDKLRLLTEVIGDRLGVQPAVYRAGRYGVGAATGRLLHELGYRVDTSIAPFRDFRDQEGPAFFGYPTRPYWTGPERALLELPLTSALVGPLARAAEGWAPLLFGHRTEATAFPSVLRRFGLVERIKLTPEGIPLEEAKRLVRALLARGQTVFALSYHSPSLTPGATPYVRSFDDLRAFLGWLDEFYRFFFDEIGGMPATPLDIHDLAKAATPPAARRAG